jgi:hypothetical protein
MRYVGALVVLVGLTPLAILLFWFFDQIIFGGMCQNYGC